MKLVVDASALSSQSSGVGIYTSSILERLPAGWGVELRGAPPPGATARPSWLRRVPGAYAVRRLRLGWPPVGPEAVFWAPNFVAPPWPLVRGRVVLTVHDLIFFDHPEWADATRGAYLRRHLPRSIASAAAVVVSTQAAKQAIAQRFGAGDKTHVIAPGVRALPAAGAAPLHQPLVEQAFVVAGNLEPRKDAWTALHAHRQLPAHVRREHPLIFVGAALDARYAQQLVAALDPPCSRFLGRLDDAALAALYARSAAVIVPSLAEGFGLVPLEAYVAGASVLARDLAVTRETLGDRAAYFHDVDRLRALMSAVPSKPSEAERRTLLERFTWDAAAKSYVELFAM